MLFKGQLYIDAGKRLEIKIDLIFFKFLCWMLWVMPT